MLVKNTLLTQVSLLLILFLSLFSGAKAQTIADSLTMAMQNELSRQNISGAVWAVIESDGTSTTGAAGLANIKSQIPMAPSSKVHVGSVTKPVLALGILRLVSMGKLNLHDKVSDVLPELAIKNKWEATSPLLIRHLIDHTSGLEDIRIWQMLSQQIQPETPLMFAFDINNKVLALRSAPGSIFSYSNLGYTLLGMIIERVTSLPYELFMDKEVLMPLGMHHSTFRFTSQEGKYFTEGLAMGYIEKQVEAPAMAVMVRPAAQFTTTAGDMAKLMRFLLQANKKADTTFVHPYLLQNMGEAQGTEAKNAGLQVGYGLGFQKRDSKGHLSLAHSGSIVGFNTMLALYPTKQKAYFIAINTDDESADYTRFLTILEQGLGLTQVSTVANQNENRETTFSGFYFPQVSKYEPLKYLEILSRGILIRDKGNHLTIHHLGKTSQKLIPYKDHLFIAEGKSIPSHVFYQTENSAKMNTNGTQTFVKANTLVVLLGTPILLLGCIGLFYPFTMMFINKRTHESHPLIHALVAIFLVAISFASLMMIDYRQLGDFHFPSIFIASTTFLLPFGFLISVWLSFKHWSKVRFKMFFWSFAIATFLLWILLITGTIPLFLWK
jgi:CubicO group peptidase (beta-lactamase class C family)